MEEEKKNKGLCCIDCKSILFSVESFLDHLKENPGHNWFKSGNNLVINVTLLLEVKN